MDAELKKQLNSIQAQLGELTPLIPVVYGLEEKVETLLERVPEELPTRREVNELRVRLEIVEQKLGIR